MEPDHAANGLARLAVLQDPLRRALYRFVAAQQEPVGRDTAAGALGISRRLAAFHLDKLADAGLLATSYRRLTRRRGPGAGRPAKLYVRPDNEIVVAVPPRDYELVAQVFVTTVAALGESATSTLADVARGMGRELARNLVESCPASVAEQRRALWEVLTTLGYQPYRHHDRTRLRNCPFHRLAERHRSLVCTANLHLLLGVLDQLGGAGLAAEQAPTPGQCCVEIRPRACRGRC